MFSVQNITSDPQQTQTLVLQDGTTITLSLSYSPQQFGWFITSLTYGNFQLNGFRICNSPNLLNQYRNQIPFGLACITQGNREPTQILDFSTGTAQIYILTSAEVAAYVTYLEGV
jgi:hypothetical protein